MSKPGEVTYYHGELPDFVAMQWVTGQVNREKWDKRFLASAELYATWSKDPSTKVGCVIVNDKKTTLTHGYNGLPRGADDNVPTRLERPEKYFWFEHAERNAIFNAAREGIKLEDATLYSTLCPCIDCARAIVQTGIKRVVTPVVPEDVQDKWKEHFDRTKQLFKECGVKLDFI